jgi:hypothetical protein
MIAFPTAQSQETPPRASLLFINVSPVTPTSPGAPPTWQAQIGWTAEQWGEYRLEVSSDMVTWTPIHWCLPSYYRLATVIRRFQVPSSTTQPSTPPWTGETISALVYVIDSQLIRDAYAVWKPAGGRSAVAYLGQASGNVVPSLSSQTADLRLLALVQHQQASQPTPFNALTGDLTPEEEIIRKAQAAPESDYYVKSSSVPPSDQHTDFGETFVAGATAARRYPASVTNAEYTNGRRYTASGHPIAELTVVLSGEPGMPFGAAWGAAPNIDWKYVIKVDTRYPHSLTAKVKAEHNLYPAYEVIIGNSDDTYVPIWQIKPSSTIFPGAWSLNQNITPTTGNEIPIK